MSEIKLLPCPFCGGEVEKIAEQIDAIREGIHFHCDNCGMNAYYDYSYDKEASIEKWNTRKPMERIVERLEEMKANAFDEEYVALCDAIKIVKEEGKNNADT